MVNLMRMQTVEYPTNALLDVPNLLAPATNALLNYTRGVNAAEQTKYERGRQAVADGRESARYAQQQKKWKQEDVQALAKSAQALEQRYPANHPMRAAAWKSILDKAKAYGPLDLTPDEMDPIKGPGLLMTQAGEWTDPRDSRKKDLELQKLEREAKGGGQKFGMSGTVVQDKDGNQFAVQFGQDGTIRTTPLQANGVALTPNRGTRTDGDTVIDNATGRPVGNVGPALERGALAKGRGEDGADFLAKFPKVQSSFNAFNRKTDNLIGTIDRAIAKIGPNTTGWGALLASMPQTEARALQAEIQTIKANLAFNELQDMRNNNPTGGALGAVTERELDLLSSTEAAIDQMMQGQQLRENMQLVRQNMMEIKRIREQGFVEDQARYRSLATPSGADGGAALQRRAGQPFLEGGWSEVSPNVKIRVKP